MRRYDKENLALIDRLSKLKWEPRYYKTVENPNAPDGKVDMYLLIDSECGEGIVSVGVPHGADGLVLATYIAECCSKPFFAKTERKLTAEDTELAVKFNFAIREMFPEDVDARKVGFAASVIFSAYVGDIPMPQRTDVINQFSVMLSELREKP